jgi:hypothetical protein
MEVTAVRGGFKGTLDAAGNTVTGQWTQGPNTLPLNLTKGPLQVAKSEAEMLSPADLAASKEAARKMSGVWNGTLVAGATNLRLRINLTPADEGVATGTMDSLDQGVTGIPINAVTLKEGKVRFEVHGVGGVYEGILAADNVTLSGKWQQRGQSLPLDFKKTKADQP